MNTNWLRNCVLGTLLVAGLAVAQPSQAPSTDNVVSARILHEIRMYPRYSIFDDLKFQVTNGNVALLGEVDQPYKKAELGKIISKVSGVTAVDNELRVAPLSSFDDSLRIQVARAIYRDPVLSRYGMGTLPSIHILVDNGHVTLEGVVDTASAKQIAGIRASSGLSFGPVVNNLRVANETPAKRS